MMRHFDWLMRLYGEFLKRENLPSRDITELLHEVWAMRDEAEAVFMAIPVVHTNTWRYRAAYRRLLKHKRQAEWLWRMLQIWEAAENMDDPQYQRIMSKVRTNDVNTRSVQ